MYVFLEGADGPVTGQRTSLAAGRTLRVGRETENDVPVPQDPTLSRRHFRLSFDGSTCVIGNESRYGTKVDGETVQGEAVLRDGAEIQAGVCRFVVRFAREGSGRRSTAPVMDALREKPTDPGNDLVARGGFDDASVPSPAASYGSPPAAAGRSENAPRVDEYGLPVWESAIAPLSSTGHERQPAAAPPPAAAAAPVGPGVDRFGLPVYGSIAAPTKTSPQIVPTAAPQPSPPDPAVDATGLRAEPLSEILGRVRLGEGAVPLAARSANARAAIDALVAAGLVGDALKVLAAALPPREAVFWACRCVRASGGKLSEADAASAAAAERWAAEPTEPNRRAAQLAAEKLEYGTAAAWAAMSAFWSGGSMAPADVPPVPPPPDLMPQAVAGAVALAAVAAGAEKIDEMQRKFLASGLPGKSATA